jgi:hypothetical protein
MLTKYHFFPSLFLKDRLQVTSDTGEGKHNPTGENKNVTRETDLKELERLGDLKQKAGQPRT